MGYVRQSFVRRSFALVASALLGVACTGSSHAGTSGTLPPVTTAPDPSPSATLAPVTSSTLNSSPTSGGRPRTVVYQATGSAHADPCDIADVTYTNSDGTTGKDQHVRLPWSRATHQVSGTTVSLFVQQNNCDHVTVTCAVVIDGRPSIHHSSSVRDALNGCEITVP